jgi:hypothetical protein
VARTHIPYTRREYHRIGVPRRFVARLKRDFLRQNPDVLRHDLTRKLWTRNALRRFAERNSRLVLRLTRDMRRRWNWTSAGARAARKARSSSAIAVGLGGASD